MNVKQLLRNYAYMLKKELKRTPKVKGGDIEFCKEELKRVDQALKNKP